MNAPATARRGYYVEVVGRQVKVPGVTTIIKSRSDPGGLIHWSWNLGMQGIDYRVARDSAADAGHTCHAMVEAWLRGEAFQADVPEDVAKRAEAGFASFQEWADQCRLEVTDTELELTSAEHMYGGRLDAVGFVAGARSLLDWKTSGAIYIDHLLQARAYVELWNEHHADDPITRVHVLRFGKEHADFHHHSYPVTMLNGAWEVFRALRRVYDLDKELKAFVK